MQIIADMNKISEKNSKKFQNLGFILPGFQ